MSKLMITVECTDSSDLDWLRSKCVSAVEDEVESAEDEQRLDGKVEVTWDIDYEDE